ncbi:MAG: aminotransferase class IV [Bacteroidetes bacterium]|nr:aminotransferase class IV [Bacteroidota bacterium]
MINLNGELVLQADQDWTSNRSFLYGDGIFDTLKIVDGKVLFLEDHYFRLMASMRIVRMEIPMDFTMERFEAEIIKTAQMNLCVDSARARITFYRDSSGYYLPKTSQVAYVIRVHPLEQKLYTCLTQAYEVDLYKDFHIAKNLLSTLKTTSKMIHVTGSIFAHENGYQNCLLINDDKNVIEAINGNLFMLKDNKLITPPVSEGCLNGIMRKKILQLAQKVQEIEVVESIISPFDLQNADELFITNVITGIQPISQYRKKKYSAKLSEKLTELLNEYIQA